ncbi:MAG: hypothetical protein R3290_03335 [Acidimicrobiia bacterium]|nr:hypothetical protein [Acidimicrobiia bacterium]
MRPLALLAVVALTVTACSGEDQAGPGRLVVSDLAGSIRVLDPDGTIVESVVEATGGEAHVQPTWSPDGATVAWVSSTPTSASLRLTTGDETRSIPLAGNAFYLSWSPDADRLLVLGGAPGGVSASVVEVDEGSAVSLGTDQPWYAAWSPDGDALIVRSGPARLAVVDADGGGATSLGVGAPFQAPDWTADGRRAFAEVAGSTSRITADGLPPVDVVAGRLALDLGTDLAYQAVVDAEGVQVAYRQAGVPGRTNALVVVDDAGDQTTVWPTPVLGFAWSPDGSSLLFLTPEEGRVAWRTWDGDSVIDLLEAVPTPLFVRDYLPFFDQYARSQTFWSPASDAVAIPAVVDGRPGIWVVEPGGEPVRVADGEMVSWGRSP